MMDVDLVGPIRCVFALADIAHGVAVNQESWFARRKEGLEPGRILQVESGPWTSAFRRDKGLHILGKEASQGKARHGSGTENQDGVRHLVMPR